MGFLVIRVMEAVVEERESMEYVEQRYTIPVLRLQQEVAVPQGPL